MIAETDNPDDGSGNISLIIPFLTADTDNDDEEEDEPLPPPFSETPQASTEKNVLSDDNQIKGVNILTDNNEMQEDLGESSSSLDLDPVVSFLLPSLLPDAEDEVEEEEDEPLPFFEPTPDVSVERGSAEFAEAQRIISNDCWAVSAWMVFIEEVEAGRGGSITIVEAYQKLLAQFPRSGRFWRLLANYYIDKEEYAAAEDIFKKSLQKCRSVGLWQSYLTMMRKKTIQNYPVNSEHYQKERDILKSAFDKAIDNIGMSLESNIIWKEYLNFVKDWPENGDLDKGRKLKALRDIYQRAICTPIDDLESYWKGYETLENQAGAHLAAQLLPEYLPKHQKAKQVQKDRCKYSSRIALDHMAVPPVYPYSSSEKTRLELWNKWLR